MVLTLLKSEKFIMMNNLGKMRECFNESNFFSTEVSTPSRSILPKEVPLLRLPSRFEDEPQMHLAKVRQRYKEAQEKCAEALRGAVRARSQLQQTEKDVAVSRFHFLRLYNAKKFRIDQQGLLSSHRSDKDFAFHLSIQRTRQRRNLDAINLSSRKEEQVRRIEDLSQTNRQERSIFRQTLKAKQEKTQAWVDNSAQKIKKQRATFQVRKKNLADLNATKSRFNYLSQVNQEMQAIKQYQQLVQRAQESAETQRETERKSFSKTYANSFR